ncbi:MAG: hypothetical protein NXI30_17690 [bacterium]|nr:hypothetical protein [bacterium]
MFSPEHNSLMDLAGPTPAEEVVGDERPRYEHADLPHPQHRPGHRHYQSPWGTPFNDRVLNWIGDSDKELRLKPDPSSPAGLEQISQLTSALVGELAHGLSGEEREVLRRDIKEWLETGTIAERWTLIRQLRTLIRTREVSEHDLAGRTVCRLVRKDQLRYDRNYHALYQLSPSHHREILRRWQEDVEGNSKKKRIEQLQRVRESQAIYWSLGPAIQSAIAMFDSDLGRDFRDVDGDGGEDQRSKLESLYRNRSELVSPTKGLMRIVAKPDLLFEGFPNEAHLDPTDLNLFSPLRYWAPVSTFARSVFHLLFWQPIATGLDLYGRRFPHIIDGGKTSPSHPLQGWMIRRRAEFYYVAMTSYQSTNFRPTKYSEILELLLELAREIEKGARKKARENGCSPGEIYAHQLGNISFGFEGIASSRWVMEHFPKEQLIEPPSNWRVTCKFPFSDNGRQIYELATQPSREEPLEGSSVHDLLIMLRNRILELAVWADSQREIRSQGTIPIEQLYSIDLEDVEGKLLAPLRESDDEKLFELLRDGTLDRVVRLRRVYDRTHHEQLDRNESILEWPELSSEQGKNETGPAAPEPSSDSAAIAKEWLIPNAYRSTRDLPLSPHVDDAQDAYREIVPLNCLWPMTWYYRGVRDTIRYFARGDAERVFAVPSTPPRRWIDDDAAQSMPEADRLARRAEWELREEEKGDRISPRVGQRTGNLRFLRMERGQIDRVCRYINTDLLNYALEFYLQRKRWALDANGNARDLSGEARRRFQENAFAANPFPELLSMKSGCGFRRILDTKNPDAYSFNEFLGDSHTHFAAIHGHLVAVNETFARIHKVSLELPLGSFSDAARAEVLHLTSEMDRVMEGMMVAIHLQPRVHRESDLVSYIVTSRSDAQRLIDTLPRYYQDHRLRLVIEGSSASREGDQGFFPTPCLPDYAGAYMELLTGFELVASHALAILSWSIRMMALWYQVPSRVLQSVSPAQRV